MTDHEKRYLEKRPQFQDVNGKYILPNDFPEHERLISQHKSFIAAAGGRLIHVDASSLANPQKLLDIGCGTGTVTRELSDLYPAAKHVYGIDLSAVPADPEAPEKDKHRTNLSFIQGDFNVLAGTHPDLAWDSFDLCYSRLLILGVTDWVGFAARVFRLLKPGGWAQMAETCNDVYFDGTLSDRPKGFLARENWGWLKAIREGGRAKGFDPDAGANIPGYLEACGFVEVRQTKVWIPYWRGVAEEMPRYRAAAEHHIGDPYELYVMQVARQAGVLGYSEEEIRQFQLDSRRDLSEEPGKYQYLYVTIGRKPSVDSM